MVIDIKNVDVVAVHLSFALTIVDVVPFEDVLFVILLVISFGERNYGRSNGKDMTIFMVCFLSAML
jgi:hypothetical protein